MNTQTELPANVVSAIRSDRKIEAIKLLHEQCNMSLKEAKDAVDAFQDNGSHFESRQSSNSGLPANILDAIYSDQKIEAIKLLREHYNVSLKEAKDLVFAYQENGPDFNASQHLKLEPLVHRTPENNDSPAVARQGSNVQLPSDVIEAIRSDRISEAIALLREQRNLGFKEASDIVNAHANNSPVSSRRGSKSNSGFKQLAVVILLAIAVYGIYRSLSPG